MVRRLSEDARRFVLGAAIEEARRRCDRRIGTGHLLLGLLHDRATAGALGVDLESGRAADLALDQAALAAIGIDVMATSFATTMSAMRRPALTSGARAVFKRALDNARLAKSRRIETKHFLLALLDCERPDPAAELMQALGVDPSTVRVQLGR